MLLILWKSSLDTLIVGVALLHVQPIWDNRIRSFTAFRSVKQLPFGIQKFFPFHCNMCLINLFAKSLLLCRFVNYVDTTLASLHPVHCTRRREVKVEFDMTTIPAFLVVFFVLWFVLKPRRAKPKINWEFRGWHALKMRVKLSFLKHDFPCWGTLLSQ